MRDRMAPGFHTLAYPTSHIPYLASGRGGQEMGIGIRRLALAGWLGLALVWVAALAPARSAPRDELERGFADPPASARPHTWWHWINGNVTPEGITADLEAMQRVG